MNNYCHVKYIKIMNNLLLSINVIMTATLWICDGT